MREGSVSGWSHGRERRALSAWKGKCVGALVHTGVWVCLTVLEELLFLTLLS